MDIYLLELSLILTSVILLNEYIINSVLLSNLTHIPKLILKTALGCVIDVVFLAIGSPLFLFLWGYSKIVKGIVKIKDGGKVTEALNLDTLWATDDKGNRPFITVVFKVKGNPNVDKLRKMVNEKVLNEVDGNGMYTFRKLRQMFVKKMGFYMWEDVDNFEVESHITILKMPFEDEGKECTKDIDDGEEDFCRFLSSPEYPVIPLSCPQWQILVVDIGKEGSYYVVFRFDHAISDGISLVRLLLEKMIDNPSHMGEYKHPVPAWKRFLTFVWSFPLFPFSLRLLIFQNPSNVLHGPQLTGTKNFASSAAIPMETLREIRTRAGVGVTDVLFSCVSAAVNKHFAKRNCHLPNIVIFFPVGYQDPNADISLTNLFGVALTEFPIEDTQWTPGKKLGQSVSRLKLIRKTLNNVKSDPSMVGLFHISSILVGVLPHCLHKILFSFSGITLGLSNMPGPKEQIIFTGDPVDSLRFWVPDKYPNAVGITMVSYNGSVRISLHADKAVIPKWTDAQDIIRDFMDEVQNLKRELLI